MSIDWKGLIVPVANILLAGEPYKSTRDGRRYGEDGSLLVHTIGPRRGGWYDFEYEEGGGVLDLIQHILETDKKGAVKWLRDNGLLKDDDRDRWEGPKPAPAAVVRALGGKIPPPPPSPRLAPAPPTTPTRADPSPAPPAAERHGDQAAQT